MHEPLIQSTLITTNADLEFVNDVATSYECAQDGMTWTFKIRDDIKSTDGTPLKASDVAFTINGILNSDASECDLSMVPPPDDTTVVINRLPFNALLHAGGGRHQPEHASVKEYGANPIGSGRYMLEQWDKGQQASRRTPTTGGSSSRAWSAWRCSWKMMRRLPLPSPARWTWRTPLRRSRRTSRAATIC